eukprot:3834851-Rhodomonas_salina.3
MGIRTTQERWMTNIERNKADDKAQTFGEHVTHPSTAKSEKTSVSAPPPRSNPPYHDLEKMIAFERKMDQFRNLRAQIRMHEVQSVHRKTSAGASYLGQTCSRGRPRMLLLSSSADLAAANKFLSNTNGFGNLRGKKTVEGQAACLCKYHVKPALGRHLQEQPRLPCS